MVERLHAVIAPVVDGLGLELVDLEHGGGVVRLTVDHPGGIDLETIAEVTRAVSRELDHADPIPGHYTLEVSSPGLERPLRTPAHFRRAIGEQVSVKTHARVEGERRTRGVLAAVDDDGITVRVTAGDQAGSERRLAYDEIETARTVFEWGPSPKPTGTRRKAKQTAARPAAVATATDEEEEQER